MKFLLEYGFSDLDIENFTANVPPLLLDKLTSSYLLVSKNIESMKQMGIQSYKNIFLKFYDMFLMDNSNFVNVFNKYDLSDLVEKIDANYEIVEFL